MRYSLSDYTATIKLPASLSAIASSISIGGQGSYLDTVDVGLDNDLWSMSSYSTGGYVLNKNLARTGTITFTLNQLADVCSRLRTLQAAYYPSDAEAIDDPCTIEISNKEGTIVSATDCYLQKIPNQQYQAQASTQSWTFLCGVINFA